MRAASEHESPGGEITHYRITVDGNLPGDYSDRLSGLRITTTSQFGRPSFSVLDGLIRDQSELMGVLNTLHELHLPILRVECVSAADELPEA